MVARLLGWRYRRPVVYQCHEYISRNDRLPPGSRMARWFEQRFARTASFVIAPDQDRANAMQRELFLPDAPLVAANAPRWTPRRSSNRLRTTLLQAGKAWEKIVFGRAGLDRATRSRTRCVRLLNGKIQNGGLP